MRMVAAATIVAPCGALAAAPPVALRYELILRAERPVANAAITIGQDAGQLRRITLDASRIEAPKADGRLQREGRKLHWEPPARGGVLRYRIELARERASRNGQVTAFDAWVGDRVAVFRGTDAFPITAWRRGKTAQLAGELAVTVPKGWSVITPYRPDARGRMPVVNPGARRPRPLGWIMAGSLGTRREQIAGLELTVSAPRGLRMERLGMLAVLRLTLPRLVTDLDPGQQDAGPPPYLNIVAAGEPMWLGALAAPNSVYVHAARPLLSENGTSTIVHEMVHVLLADLDTPRDQDWLDEGLAEYLSLRALREAGLISGLRFDAAIAEFRQRGATVTSLRTAAASGAVTARAVAILHDLDVELTRRNAKAGLETLVRQLLQERRVASLATLRGVARRSLGREPRALAPANVPGFN
jgi:hypothetical protein